MKDVNVKFSLSMHTCIFDPEVFELNNEELFQLKNQLFSAYRAIEDILGERISNESSKKS